MIRMFTITFLFCATLVVADSPGTSTIEYSIPEGYTSLMSLNLKTFNDTKKQMEEGEDGLKVIDSLARINPVTNELDFNILISKAKSIKSTDKEHLEGIARLFKQNSLGDYSTKEWNQGYFRLNAIKQKITYFAKTINGNQYVYIINYRSEELPSEVEKFILSVRY